MVVTFGNVLENLLKQQQMTGKDLAKAIGVSTAMISHLISGNRKPPLKQLDAMADALSLEGDERIAFIIEGELTHTPANVRRLFTQSQ